MGVSLTNARSVRRRRCSHLRSSGAHGPGAHGQAGDRHRRQPRHRQGDRPGAREEGCDVVIAARDADAWRRPRRSWPQPPAGGSSPVVVDTGVDDVGRGHGRPRPSRRSAASTSWSTTPPSRAARRRRPKLAEITDELFWDDVNVKVMGYLRCAREVAPLMAAKGWGRIINICGLAARSTGSTVGTIRNVAVAALTKNLADELGPHGHQRHRRPPRPDPHRGDARRGRRAGRAAGHRRRRRSSGSMAGPTPSAASSTPRRSPAS